MIQKLADDYFLVSGMVAKDAEFKRVGAKNTPLASLNVSAGKNKDTTTIWITLKAWRGLANVAADAKKGDAVLAVGKLETREYNGKMYTDLSCDWLNVAGIEELPAFSHTTEAAADDVSSTSFSEIADGDGELPF